MPNAPSHPVVASLRRSQNDKAGQLGRQGNPGGQEIRLQGLFLYSKSELVSSKLKRIGRLFERFGLWRRRNRADVLRPEDEVGQTQDRPATSESHRAGILQATALPLVCD